MKAGNTATVGALLQRSGGIGCCGTYGKPIKSLLVLLVCCSISCKGSDTLGNPWPARLSTRHDIERTKTDTDYADIWNLPVQDYHLLTKFVSLKRIMLDSREGTLATDRNLQTLASLNFTNLTEISMLNCRLITDVGLRGLTNIPSLQNLGLEGTAVTDVSCQTICAKMRLRGIDVASCKAITLKGLRMLASSDSLTDFEFSAENLTQDQVLDLIGSFKNVKSCWIVDLGSRLDARLIESKGGGKGLRLYVRHSGALQDKYGIPE